MLIVCPSCATSYEIGETALGASGRSVRCTSCRSTWFARPTDGLATAVALEAAVAVPEPAPHPPIAVAPPAERESFADPGDQAAIPEIAIAPAEAPPIVPDHLLQTVEPPEIKAETVPESIETVAARRARRGAAARHDRRAMLRRLASAPMLIFLMLVALATIIQWRDRIVRHVPQTASLFAAIGMPVNLRGLIFEGVTSRTEISDGAPVLIVEGTIVNLTTRRLEVPRLRFALRNEAGHEVYAWTVQPPKPAVGSGNGLAFHTRLASPPADGRDVIVRFFNRRDVTAGMQ